MAAGASGTEDTPNTQSNTGKAPDTTTENTAPETGAPAHSAETEPRKNIGTRLREKQGTLLAGLLAVCIFMLYNYYSSQQLLHWITPSWDLAIFTQMAQAYSRFEMPIVPIKGPDFNLWGDHFHPILMLLGPVYAFFPSPMTLLVVQNGMVALSVYLTVRFAQRALGGLNGHVVGVLLAAAFGLSYGVQQAVAAQFHEVAFALPFLSLSLGHLVLAGTQQNPQRASHITHACWWAAPLAFVKEDMGVTAAVIGAVALIRSGWLREAANTLFPHASKDVPAFWPRLREVFSGWTKSRGAAEATLLMVWGLFWSYTSMNLILPIFNVNHQFDYADKVDLFGALKNPLNALQLLFTPDEKAQSLWLLLMVGVFLWVVSPLAAVALPTIAWRMLSSNSSYWLSTWHYSLVLMPIVFMALLDVLVRVHEHRRRVAASAHDKAAADQNTAYQKPEQQNTAGSDWAKPYRNATQAIILKTPLWLVPLLALVFTVAPILTAQPTQPLAQLTDPVFTTTDQTNTEVNKRRAVDAVPIGASVATDLSIITELIPGRTVYWIGHHGEPAPDYVVIDRAGTAWGGKPPTNAAQYAADRYGHPYEVAERVGTIDIVRRTDK